MEYNEIVNNLKRDRKPFKSISHFSDKPGIYAVFYYGEKFPLDKEISDDEIIYIGKTESSQQSRDADTHFTSGKTGSSTLRRSLGSLLREEMKLVPIPRNKKDFQKGRTTFFKFNDYSEVRLTNWMTQNLGLSFYEFPKSPGAIDYLETELINHVKPILNLAKNSANPFGKFIKEQRKICGQIAFGTEDRREKNIESKDGNQISGSDSDKLSFINQLDPISSNWSNPSNKYKLHEAMEIVLKECPSQTASFQYISDEIWKRGLYKQKAGGAAPASQIRLRARNYSQFKIIDGQVKLDPI